MKRLSIFWVAFLLMPSAGAESLDTIIQRESVRSGVVPDLIRAVIRVESNGHVKARSPKGAGGLMQLMPETAARFGVKNVDDPAQNIRGGSTYLAWLYRRYGDWRLALAGYNAGEGAVDKYSGIPPYKETRNYVIKVLKKYGQLAGNKPKPPSFQVAVPVQVNSKPQLVINHSKPVPVAAVRLGQGERSALLQAARYAPTAVLWEPPAGYYD